MVGVEAGLRDSQEARSRTTAAHTDYHDGVVALYQQYLGRTPNEEEIRSWYQQHPNLSEVEPLLKNSGEAQTYAKAHPAAAAPGTPGTGAPGTGGATGYDPNALRQALLASGAPANAAELKKFIDAHPEFATGVTIGGSKNNKLYGPGGVFLADVIRGTNSASPAWDWDAGTGASSFGATAGDGQTVDPSYLAGYPGGPFEAPADAALPPPFEYQEFAPPTDAKAPDPFTYDAFTQPEGFSAPDAQTILNDPSYQFRRDQALGALQNSASGRGLTNSGGTIYDLLGTASQFASQEYGNIWDRDFKGWQDRYNTALNTYNTNRGNAADIYGKNLGLSDDLYARGLTDYNTNRGNAEDLYTKLYGRSQDAYNRARDEFDASVKDYYSNRDSAFDKLYKYSALGANVTTAP
jgi:hypothetical protein